MSQRPEHTARYDQRDALTRLALERQRKHIVAFLVLRVRPLPVTSAGRTQLANDTLGAVADGSFLVHLESVPEAERVEAYERAFKLANAERNAVVAWLRAYECDSIADSIEQGEHVK